MILAAMAMHAAQQPPLVDEEALRAGAPVVRQFLEEARDAFYQATAERTTFIVDDGGNVWIEAEAPDEARAAVLGLLAVVEALGRRESPLIRLRCPRAGCLDRRVIARRIRPLDPGAVRSSVGRGCGSNGRYRCLRVFIGDVSLCGGWALDMESGWEEPFRLRSATLTQRANIALHCDGGDASAG
jgi:hypothetical protein